MERAAETFVPESAALQLARDAERRAYARGLWTGVLAVNLLWLASNLARWLT